MLFSSLHFANRRAEELVTVLAIQKDPTEPYTFHFSNLPVMNPSFLNQLKAKTQSLQEEERIEELFIDLRRILNKEKGIDLLPRRISAIPHML